MTQHVGHSNLNHMAGSAELGFPDGETNASVDTIYLLEESSLE